MSFFKNIFGGKKADAGPTASESIQQLRDTENMLLKKQEYLESKIEAETKIAKENATTNKRGNCMSISELSSHISVSRPSSFRRSSIFFVLFLCLRKISHTLLLD